MGKTRWLSSVTPAILLALVIFASTLSAAEWKEQVLYSFQGAPDGAVPAGSVVFDKAGNLYGATDGGGSSSCDGPGQCGTVYQLTPPTQKGGAWTETVLYIFKGHAQNDGATPEGGLLIDEAGNLYGTTGYGGSGPCLLLGGAVGCGTVYKLSPPAKQGDPWTETVLYSFQGGKDGYVASGDLVFDKAGNLYGATLFGGGKGTTCDSLYGGQCGTVFRLSPPQTKGGKWAEKVLRRFAGVASGAQFGDGANPNGGLVLDGNGAIYGTTYFGGNNMKGQCEGGVGGTGCGIVFKLAPPSQKGGKWTGMVLHQFDGQDGSNSTAGVVFDGNGNLYGTTSFGPGPYGLVFALKKPSGKVRSWTETVLHRFTDGTDGANPMSSFIFDSGGNLYGTAYRGSGASQYGNVFKLVPHYHAAGEWVLDVLYGFDTGGAGAGQPAAALVFDKRGNLYSTTQFGGTGESCQGGCGTVFEVSP
jgi:hypothetical protein